MEAAHALRRGILEVDVDAYSYAEKYYNAVRGAWRPRSRFFVR